MNRADALDITADGLLTRMPELEPFDEHNRFLLENGHPPRWVNPKPAKRYNLVVLGGGTAGLVAAAGAAGLGAKVALVERRLMGGDCLNVGCVPSKALIRCARAAADAASAGRFGVRIDGEINVEFAEIMERMRRLRAKISPHDSVERFTELGIDVFIGEASFIDESSVRVRSSSLEGGGRGAGEARTEDDGSPHPPAPSLEGRRSDSVLRFSRALIATGARASAPPIPGLKQAGFLTNETVFSLTQLPPRLAVIGAGPIGCEMAQAFARFGSEVTLIEAEPRIMPREDADAARIVARQMERDGMKMICGGKAAKIETRDGEKIIDLDCEGRQFEVHADDILIGVGRQPNVDGLKLEAAGVEYGPRAGVKVNDYLQTTSRNIYAAGDICSPLKFTHLSDAHARIVIQNALFFGRARAGRLIVPWCTYTDPEVAHVGMYEQEAKEKGINVRTHTIELRNVDRAILDGEEEGFLKIHTKAGSDRILGATLVARHAGEMISEITLAMTHGVGLKGLSSTIHPYPTQAEAMRKAGDAFNRERLTPLVRNMFTRLLAWRR